MTLKELSQLYYLNLEIGMDKKRLAALKAKISGSSGPKLNGMPKGPNHYGSHMENYIAEAVDLEEIIRAKIKQCTHERNRLERYIADIPDSLTRQVFTYRFVEGLSWVQVAAQIGGGNTEMAVRQRVYRYLSEKNKSCHTM